MEAGSRREKILEMIRQQQAPVSASRLAQTLQVSRQIIVGDVALLRAQGCEIIATARGYIVPQPAESGRYLGKVACQHTAADTVWELYAIVDAGAVVVNVVVDHDLYGEIAGQLNLSSREDVDAFVQKAASTKAKLLSELTMGVHLHTVACRGRDHFEQVRQALEQKGYLFHD